MDITCTPYIDQELKLLIERIHPPRVCVDNDTSPDCTLVKVDSANKNGMLLEMVQVLTDLDLVIIKSYISSDGGWLMDVFHVTDQLGNKITDESLINCIQEGICSNRKAKPQKVEEAMRPKHVMTGNMALEMTGIDRPGLMSEMSAVLAELECHITAAVAWTHNSRVACIIYVEDSDKSGAIMDSYRAAKVQARLKKVVEAHHYNDEKRSVRLEAPTPAQTHKERRLHQLLAADRDYEECCSCCDDDDDKEQEKGCDGTHVKVENCRKMGYSIVTVRSRDRPKLLFDTVCTLTDLQYVVYHAAISSKCSHAFQEYYVKHKNGCIMETEDEKHRVIKCLIAATKRRISHGLRLDISTSNRTGLLSEVTRAFRENGLSITRAEIGIRGEKAVGTFYVKDASGQDVNPETLEILRQEIGGNILVENNSSENTPPRTSSAQKFSLGNLLWAQLERILGNFRLLKS